LVSAFAAFRAAFFKATEADSGGADGGGTVSLIAAAFA
jgi:hypothetical protein